MALIDYETQYNARAQVPEHPAIIEGWAHDAAAYREVARCELGIRYDIAPRCTFDLFHPDTPQENAPIAVFIHGGYWQALDGSYHSHHARGLNRRGLMVAVPSYDLCPQVHIGDIIEEIRALCIHLWENYRRPLVLCGHSAGGHLTAAAMATDWPGRHIPARLVIAGYAISGLFDLIPLVGTSINTTIGMTESEAGKASPIGMGAPGNTCFTAAVGSDETDEFFRQSRVICDLWQRGGTRTRLDMIEGANHFTVVAPLGDPNSEMVAAIARMAGLPE